MNQKAYSVLFCALLASTFVHELRAKGVAHPPVSRRLEVFERASSTEVCIIQCTIPSNVNISVGLTVEVIENVLVIANLSANAALLINVTSQIVVLLNGTSGSGVAINISSQTGVYVPSGLWVASSVSLEAFIESLSGGLSSILNISGGISFSVSTASSTILQVVNLISINLVSNLAAGIKQNAQLGLQIVVAISAKIIVLLNGSLTGLLSLIGSTAIGLAVDLAGFVNILTGFAQIIVLVGSSSLTALVEQGVVFSLSAILSAQNGLLVLTQILLEIGAVIDVGAKLGTVLNNAQSLFTLIASLGGNSSIGISGVFLVVANIVGLINQNVTLEVTINSIIQYVAYSSVVVTGDLSTSLNVTLGGLLQVVEKLNASSSLSGLVTIVNSLVAGSLVIGGVNISNIITELLTGVIVGASNLLQIVAWVVIQLQSVVALSIAIPYLLLILILKANVALGLWQLILLQINLDLSLLSIVGSILKNSLSGVVSLVLALLTGNFYDALTNLPVIGTIIVALNTAIVSASSSAVSLKSLLNASTTVKLFIEAIIQSTSGIYLGVSSTVLAQVNAIAEVTSSASASIGVNITASASVSISG